MIHRLPLALPLVGGLALLVAGQEPAPATPAASAAASPPIRFEEVAKQSGLDYVNLCGEADKPRIIDTLGGGVCWFDYDGDGWLDLFVPNGATLAAWQGKEEAVPSDKLFRNQGDGTFVDVTEKAGLVDRAWGSGVAAGDYDNDGDEDLYVCNLGKNFLYRNNGDGTFTDVAEPAGVTFDGVTPGAAWGDYDLDGDLDLYVAAYISFDIKRPLPPFAKNMRGMKVMFGPKGLRGAPDKLFRNDGPQGPGGPGGPDGPNGTVKFTDVTATCGLRTTELEHGFTIQIFDMDGDDIPDIFVANDMTPNHHYKGIGNGKLLPSGDASGLAVDRNGEQQACMGIAVGDVNDDQLPDLFITNFTAELNAFYLSQGGNLWEDTPDPIEETRTARPYVKWGTGLFDFDRDGDEDLVLFNGHVFPQVESERPQRQSYRQPSLLYRRDGPLAFTEVSEQAGEAFQKPRCARGAGFADYDEDGDVDIAVFDMDAPLELLRNVTGDQGHFLRVALRGTKSNRDGFGARVTVEAGGKRFTRWVLGQGSFISQNDPRAHVGLGALTTVDKVTVRWPGGKEDVVSGPLAVDRTLLVREGEGNVGEILPGRPTLFPKPAAGGNPAAADEQRAGKPAGNR